MDNNHACEGFLRAGERDRIARGFRKALGVQSEAYGLFALTKHSSSVCLEMYRLQQLILDADDGDLHGRSSGYNLHLRTATYLLVQKLR